MPDLLYEKRDDYAIFTYNRPERLNALGGQLINQLTEAVEDFTEDPKMRVGIVTGSGRAFCAGGDLKEMAEGTFKGQFAATYPYSGNPKPFIAAINGLAVGGGHGDGAGLRHPDLLDGGLLRPVRAEARDHGWLRHEAPREGDRALGGQLHPADRRPHRAGAGAEVGA